MSNVQIELKFAGINLAKKDLLSKSDPQVLVFQRIGEADYIYEGCTEKINNDNYPKFSKSVKLDYFFEVCQNITVMVVDVDGFVDKKTVTYKDVKDHDLIGVAKFSLGELLSKPASKAPFELRSSANKPAGQIVVEAELIQKTTLKSYFDIVGTNFDKKDLFGKSDPYYKIFKVNNDSTFTEVFKSDIIMENLNPIWKEQSVWFDDLCSNDASKSLKFEFYDYDKVGAHDLIGSFTTTWSVISSAPDFPFQLLNPKKSGKTSGTVVFKNVRTIHKYSMLQYLQGGLKMQVMFGIDLTYSNLPINHPDSLHLIKDGFKNQYETSLQEIGQVLIPYVPDGQVQVKGFGARLPYGVRDFHDNPSHLFNFDLVGKSPYGVDGLIECYKKNVGYYYFDGPTNFAPLIKYAAEQVKDYSQTNQEYMVLVIITDGDICDMPETKQAIAEASNLPLSIVIVGVGEESFSRMKELDGDKKPLTSTYGYPVRDIVQFVPFLKVLKDGRIAKETLREIPKQLTEHFRLANITPNPPPAFVYPQPQHQA